MLRLRVAPAEGEVGHCRDFNFGRFWACYDAMPVFATDSRIPMWEGQEMAGMAVAVLVGSMSMAPATAAADGIVPNASHTPHTSHVRSEDVAIMKFVERAREASETFRRLVDAIDASDGLVYIQEGRCPNNAPACFIGVTAAGKSRTLWVRVNLRIKRPDWDVMGSIAHELRHAVEVLEVPSIRSTAAMYLFYRNVGFRATPPNYETLPALDAGYAVRSEIRSHTQSSDTD